MVCSANSSAIIALHTTINCHHDTVACSAKYPNATIPVTVWCSMTIGGEMYLSTLRRYAD